MEKSRREPRDFSNSLLAATKTSRAKRRTRLLLPYPRTAVLTCRNSRSAPRVEKVETSVAGDGKKRDCDTGSEYVPFCTFRYPPPRFSRQLLQTFWKAFGDRVSFCQNLFLTSYSL